MHTRILAGDFEARCWCRLFFYQEPAPPSLLLTKGVTINNCWQTTKAGEVHGRLRRYPKRSTLEGRHIILEQMNIPFLTRFGLKLNYGVVGAAKLLLASARATAPPPPKKQNVEKRY